MVLLALGAVLSIAPLASASHGTDGTPVQTRLTLPTSDIAFDPLSQKIYASVPSRAGSLGNRVVVIDPATGAVGPSVFVGSEPGKLALSADGQFLYVALNGAAAVRRVQLASLTAGLQFSLGADPFFGPYRVEDMEVLSSDPGAVAVSRMNAGFSPRHAGVAIYDEGVKLPDETPRHTGSNVIEFGSSATRLYGYNNETTEFGFRRMTVGSSGVSTVDVAGGVISGFGVDIEFDGGKVYATNGAVIDPEARTLLGTYQVSSAGPVEPDAAHGKVYFVSSGELSEFDEAMFTLRQSFPIAGMTGTPSSLVNIGRSDLAFRTSGDQIFLVHFQSSPTTVLVRSFSAQRSRAGVQLRWRTAQELGLLGFDVYRSSGVGLTKLNRALIRGRGSATGAPYSWVDRNAPKSRIVYRLREVRADGTRVWLKSIVVRS